MRKAVALAALLGILGSVAFAGYPEKPVEIVAWASPGGGSDVMCRTFAKALETVGFPQPLYVVNKPGGSGAVGMTYVQGKPADGYTILGVTNNLIFTPLTTPGFQYSFRDFEPILMFGYDPKYIVVASNSRYQTIEDLVNFAKAHPGEVKVGTFGPGSDDHVVGMQLAQVAGVEFNFIPFDSGGEILASLLGGHIDAQVAELSEVKGQLDAGAVRILAVATAERVRTLPDVPTLKEKGWDVALPKFRGFMVKKGTPAEVVQILIDWAVKAVQSDVFQAYLEAQHLEPALVVGPDFTKILVDYEAAVKDVLQALGQ
ncbi:MAG: tripartite tricarboxylate transporter substrate binding protein [Candidatus Bipolaricaulota bacterium]|nr:tripartite tricarboxylate transporter substrate binding protein [Candidatus Bipolaricaulota bacterium]MDW8126412.1 tripartite tricarboxylate transporter substrate binding protein [Candidatus Bipolaricaulota bacterium]